MSKFGGGIGAPSKEERLKEAAEIHLRLGQIQRYCELMVELGEVKYQTVIENNKIQKFMKTSYPSKACIGTEGIINPEIIDSDILFLTYTD